MIVMNHSDTVLYRHGVGATHRWPGYCFALGPDGSTLAESSRESNAPSILYADLDPALLGRWREGAADMRRYRRPETYGWIAAAVAATTAAAPLSSPSQQHRL